MTNIDLHTCPESKYLKNLLVYFQNTLLFLLWFKGQFLQPGLMSGTSQQYFTVSWVILEQQYTRLIKSAVVTTYLLNHPRTAIYSFNKFSSCYHISVKSHITVNYVSKPNCFTHTHVYIDVHTQITYNQVACLPDIILGWEN